MRLPDHEEELPSAELDDSEVLPEFGGTRGQSAQSLPEMDLTEPAEAPWDAPSDFGTSAAPLVRAEPAPAEQPDNERRKRHLAAIEEVRRLGTEGPASSDISDADVGAAQGRDRQQAHRDNFTEALSAALQRRPARMRAVEEATGLLEQKKPADSQANATWGRKLTAAERIAALWGTAAGGDDDGSLAQRRKDLSDEARNRLQLSREQLEALNAERERKGGLSEREIAERERHNRALEEAKKKGPKAPLAKITAGDINTVPERRAGYRNLIKAIAENRAEAPKAASRYGSEVVSDVLAYKPDFDATRFGNYAAVGKQQATGKDVVAISVAREHLGTAKKLIPHNADAQFVNRVKQAIASGTGDAQFKPFIAASTVAAHELAKVYGIEDQAGKAMVEHQLAAAQSPEQLRAVFETFEELIVGKQRGLERQMQAVAPQGAAPPPAGKVTPGGKPYAKKQVSPSTGKVRYVNEAGAVIEEG